MKQFSLIVMAWLMVTGIGGQASANTVNLNFTFTLQMPTCTVEVTPSTLNWGTLNLGQAKKNSTGQQKSFTLTVTKCNGVGYPGVMPQIMLEGQTLYDERTKLAPAATQTDTLKKLFTSSTSTAQYVGFSVCITQVGNDGPTNCSVQSASDLWGSSQKGNEWLNLAQQQGAAMPASITGWIQPSVGDLTQFATVGALSAAIQFQLRYN